MDLKISGKKFQISSLSNWSFSFRPGGWLIAESDQGERKRLMAWEDRGKISFSLDGKLYFGEWIEPKKSYSSSSSKGNDESDFTAQFPGKVRKLLVQPGNVVSEGDPLILVEAMKMEFTIKAPTAGKVTQVFVQEGQQLSPGDRFFDFEEVKLETQNAE